ncbi:MAG: VTC domain-containing protein [Candidatus Omnitrophica bacterium]|nr:VTC domain-containing protein [Candidatus Omnitrophota bacterium]
MKNLFFSGVKHFRYERKFFIESLNESEIEALILAHPALFREIYYRRRVNNIYFDTFSHAHYFDNIDGADKRLKVRLRWYGNTFGEIKKPALEVKLKHNLHVGKLIYPITPFILNEKFSLDKIQKTFKEAALPEALKMHLAGLKFSLLNGYSRKYFLSADRNYRVTVDTQMEAYKILSSGNTFLSRDIDRINVILELKYNKAQDEHVDKITNFFPLRITRSSKYVDAMAKISI